jgi:hypothetical protein
MPVPRSAMPGIDDRDVDKVDPFLDDVQRGHRRWSRDRGYRERAGASAGDDAARRRATDAIVVRVELGRGAASTIGLDLRDSLATTTSRSANTVPERVASLPASARARRPRADGACMQVAAASGSVGRRPARGRRPAAPGNGGRAHRREPRGDGPAAAGGQCRGRTRWPAAGVQSPGSRPSSRRSCTGHPAHPRRPAADIDEPEGAGRAQHPPVRAAAAPANNAPLDRGAWHRQVVAGQGGARASYSAARPAADRGRQGGPGRPARHRRAGGRRAPERSPRATATTCPSRRARPGTRR